MGTLDRGNPGSGGVVQSPLAPSSGGGTSSPLTTKGDIWGYSTTDARVPIGTNGQVLTADSAQVLGLKWASPAAGSLSGLAAATATNTIDNLNFAQVWNWSTLSTEKALSANANALTTGAMLELSTSSGATTTAGKILSLVSSGASSRGPALSISHAGGGSGSVIGASIAMGHAGGDSTGLDISNASNGSSGVAYAAKFRMTDAGFIAAKTAVQATVAGDHAANLVLDLSLSSSGAAGTVIQAVHSGSSGLVADFSATGTGTKDIFRIKNTVAAADNSAAQMIFAANRVTSGLTTVAGVAGMITDTTDGAYAGALIFSTADNATPVERMRINNLGQILLSGGVIKDLTGAGLKLRDFSDVDSVDAGVRRLVGTSGTTAASWDNALFKVEGTLRIIGSGMTPGHVDVLVDGGTTSYAVTLPLAQGGAGEFLQNDGSGNLSWASAGGGGTLANDTYFVGRNAANSADVNIFKVRTDDGIIFGRQGAGLNRDCGVTVYDSSNIVYVVAADSNGDNGFVELVAQDVELAYRSGASTLRFYDGDGNNRFGIKAPQTLAADTVLEWPDGVGSVGQVLTTDGNNPGALSWTTPSGLSSAFINSNTQSTDFLGPVPAIMLDSATTAGTGGVFGSTDTTSANTTAVYVMSGSITTAGGTGQTGGLNLFSGNFLGTGAANTSVKSGGVSISSGYTVSGKTGPLDLSSGDATGTGNTGGAFLRSGSATSGDSGNVEISVGTATGTVGSVIITAPSVQIMGSLRLQSLSSDPAGVAGDMYYNTSLGKAKIYTTAWETITSV